MSPDAANHEFREFPNAASRAAQVAEVFEDAFGRAPADLQILLSPLRICPLGAHVDHQGGAVLSMAINAWTGLAYAPCPEPQIDLISSQFAGRATVDLRALPAVPPDDWSRYVTGAAEVLARVGVVTHGLRGAIDGLLPGCGLSSSASLGTALLVALARVNNIILDSDTLIELDHALEHSYLGLRNGLLDPAAIVLAKRNRLLHFNTMRRKAAYAGNAESEQPRILIIDPGTRRTLTGSGFTNRVEECRGAARSLGELCGKPDARILGDLGKDDFDANLGRLPEVSRKRAAHFFTETRRVAAGAQAWHAGEFEQFGAMINESNTSSLENYESGSAALAALQRVIREAPGVLGSRFCGGGYAGCLLALTRRERAGEAATYITRETRRLLDPETPQADVWMAESVDGLKP